jgi:uncharacterized protein DUF3298
MVLRLLENNFQHFLLAKGGLRIFFDEYSVGSYAEGRKEVFIPAPEIVSLLDERFVRLLR